MTMKSAPTSTVVIENGSHLRQKADECDDN
jgi:hypothetical protein